MQCRFAASLGAHEQELRRDFQFQSSQHQLPGRGGQDWLCHWHADHICKLLQLVSVLCNIMLYSIVLTLPCMPLWAPVNKADHAWHATQFNTYFRTCLHSSMPSKHDADCFIIVVSWQGPSCNACQQLRLCPPAPDLICCISEQWQSGLSRLQVSAHLPSPVPPQQTSSSASWAVLGQQLPQVCHAAVLQTNNCKDAEQPKGVCHSSSSELLEQYIQCHMF